MRTRTVVVFHTPHSCFKTSTPTYFFNSIVNEGENSEKNLQIRKKKIIFWKKLELGEMTDKLSQKFSSILLPTHILSAGADKKAGCGCGQQQ